MATDEAKEVLYIYNGDEEQCDVEFDPDGSILTPAYGSYMIRNGKEWKIERTRIQTSGVRGAFPVLKIDLTDRF